MLSPAVLGEDDARDRWLASTHNCRYPIDAEPGGDLLGVTVKLSLV